MVSSGDWEGVSAEDLNFWVQRVAEWPEALRWIAFPLEFFTTTFIHWILCPLSVKRASFQFHTVVGKVCYIDPFTCSTHKKGVLDFVEWVDCQGSLRPENHTKLTLGDLRVMDVHRKVAHGCTQICFSPARDGENLLTTGTQAQGSGMPGNPVRRVQGYAAHQLSLGAYNVAFWVGAKIDVEWIMCFSVLENSTKHFQIIACPGSRHKQCNQGRNQTGQTLNYLQQWQNYLYIELTRGVAETWFTTWFGNMMLVFRGKHTAHWMSGLESDHQNVTKLIHRDLPWSYDIWPISGH